MRLRVWSPTNPEKSAPYLAEIRAPLGRRAEIVEGGEEADLDLYPLGDDPAFARPYQEALRRPGVLLLEDWNLHLLVQAETLGRGDARGYLREMRRAGGEAGSFVARQIMRGLGGDLLPVLFPLNDRLLEGSLGVVALTEHVRARAARVLPGRPVLTLPLHLLLPPEAGPGREETRRARGLGERDLLVRMTGDPLSLARAARAASRLRSDFPTLVLESAKRDEGPSSTAGADVALVLGAPSPGRVPLEVVRAMREGIPTLVSAGTPAAEEFPEGAVVPVDPGAFEEAEIEALLRLLLGDPALREAIGARARAHLAQVRGEAMAEQLASFLAGVAASREAALAALAADRAPEGSRLAYLMEEVRGTARELGLAGVHLALRPLLGPLGGRP